MIRLACICVLVLLAAGCSKSEQPATNNGAALKADTADAAKKARESVVFGDQLKSMDKAKDAADAASKAAEDRAKKAADQ